MDKHPKKQKILLVLIVLTLCFIWGNSLMPASFSGAISGWAKNVLNAILGDVGNSSVSGVKGCYARLRMRLNLLYWVYCLQT